MLQQIYLAERVRSVNYQAAATFLHFESLLLHAAYVQSKQYNVIILWLIMASNDGWPIHFEALELIEAYKYLFNVIKIIELKLLRYVCNTITNLVY